MTDAATTDGFAPRPAVRRPAAVRDADLGLTGRRVLVLWADSHAGAAIAIAMARAGAAVALVYPPGARERGRMVASIARDLGPAVAEIEADPADAGIGRALPRTAAAALDGLDVLVHTWSAPAGNENAAGDSLAANLSATIRVTDAALPLLGRGSCIVNSTATGATPVHASPVTTAAMLAAVEGWTRGLAGALLEHGVRVNTVAAADVPADADDPAAERRIHRSLQQVAQACVLVAAASPRYLTGETVHLDGRAAPWR